MAKFVSQERVPVTVEGDGNTIYIKPKMDYGTRNRVSGAAAKIRQVAGGEQTQEIDIGAYNVALLVNNIVGWSGPDFDAIECTPANIERLDPDDPLLDAVLAAINTRNTKAPDEEASTSPNSSTPAIAAGSKAK